ncbi:MAG: hypothetical protein QOE62_2168 [Actinomycetota bacterium]|nr:hypothetical protein [Actinomycetota bacterium]
MSFAIARHRRLVFSIALVAAACKLLIAATTTGTNDVSHFKDFADAIRHVGPVDVYGLHISHPPYNHPPLTGWLLVGINHLTNLLPFRLLIRSPAIIADVVTSALIFELVRVRRSLRNATIGALLVACSPVLLIISGFHGNTDPVFVMFAILSFYLITRQQSGVLAGMSFAAAISIKLVPIVCLPVLLLIAARAGRRRLMSFAAGAGGLLALTWGPVIARQWAGFDQHVLQYSGYTNPQWGLPEFARLLGVSPHGMDLLTGPGRFALLALSAGIPLLVLWRRPDLDSEAFGLALVLFLLVSTASATQYFAWAAAAAVLVDVGAAVIYNLMAGLLLTIVYDRWNGVRWPFGWDRAYASAYTHREVIVATLVWMTLLAVAVTPLRAKRRDPAMLNPEPASLARRARLRSRSMTLVSRAGPVSAGHEFGAGIVAGGKRQL